MKWVVQKEENQKNIVKNLENLENIVKSRKSREGDFHKKSRRREDKYLICFHKILFNYENRKIF